MMKATRDGLITVGVSRLRALGVITPAMSEAPIAFGDLVRIVKVEHRQFPNGGSWSFFDCPGCGRRVRKLRRLHDGVTIACKWCDGLRCGSSTRVERLRALLAHNADAPARLNSRPGRSLDRRQSLERSLRQALIVARRLRIQGWDDRSWRRVRRAALEHQARTLDACEAAIFERLRFGTPHERVWTAGFIARRASRWRKPPGGANLASRSPDEEIDP